VILFRLRFLEQKEYQKDEHLRDIYPLEMFSEVHGRKQIVLHSYEAQGTTKIVFGKLSNSVAVMYKWNITVEHGEEGGHLVARQHIDKRKAS